MMPTNNNSPTSRSNNISAVPSSGKSTHGNDSLPQSVIDPKDKRSKTRREKQEYRQQELEYDGLIAATTPASSGYYESRRKKNCCTWKVATVFLLFVVIALIVTWQLLPTEDIVVKYIPQFPEPENIYIGPEAGSDADHGASPTSSSGAGGGGFTIGLPPSQAPGNDNNGEVGIAVPSFMKCPEDGGLCCNGSPDNCKLRVDEMMFGLVHNAMSSEEGGFFIGYNHKLGLEKALVAGYRGLGLDVCNCNGVLQFCHNVCDLGERMPNEVFTNTVQFLNDYPSEVIVLVFEASKEKGPIVWNDLYAEMTNVPGFTDMIYVHTYGDEWPTMQRLVRQNKRIIIFYYNGGTCTEGDSCSEMRTNGFHFFYNYAKETRFESASVEELQNYDYSCEVTRGPSGGGALPASFFVVNNFVTPPDPDIGKIVNSKAFLSERLTKCANINKMRPNFVYLDFWSQGVTAQLVQYANKQYAQELEG